MKANHKNFLTVGVASVLLAATLGAAINNNKIEGFEQPQSQIVQLSETAKKNEVGFFESLGDTQTSTINGQRDVRLVNDNTLSKITYLLKSLTDNPEPELMHVRTTYLVDNNGMARAYSGYVGHALKRYPAQDAIQEISVNQPQEEVNLRLEKSSALQAIREMKASQSPSVNNSSTPKI